MNLAIITAIHERQALTHAFLKAMSRIRDDLGVQTYIAITTGDSNLPDVQKFGFPYLEHPNKPLGKKWNAAVGLLRNVDFSHLMILGSDDIPSSRFIENAMKYGEYDISGIDGLWFWGMNPRRAGFGRFGYFPVSKVFAGPGKVISRRIVEALDWTVWTERKNYAMDADMMLNIRRAAKAFGMKLNICRYSTLESEGFLVDVKYQSHISSLSPILRRPCYDEQDPKVVLPRHLPEDETDYLLDLFAQTELKHLQASVQKH